MSRVMNTTKGLSTQRNEVRNSIHRMKYLELAFYSNSVYISGKPFYRDKTNIMHMRTAKTQISLCGWFDQSDQSICCPHEVSSGP